MDSLPPAPLANELPLHAITMMMMMIDYDGGVDDDITMIEVMMGIRMISNMHNDSGT